MTTDPLGANLTINGKPWAKHSPVLLDSGVDKKYTVRIDKEGYSSVTTSVEVQRGAVEHLHISLSGNRFIPAFPGKDSIVIQTGLFPASGGDITLPYGRYEMNEDRGRVFLEPVYPLEDTLKLLNAAIPVSILLSVFFTTEDLLSPKTGSLPLGVPAILSWTASIGLIGADLALLHNKAQFREDFIPEPVQQEKAGTEAAELYQRAEELLVRNRLEDALDYFTQVVAGHQESYYFPLSLYKTGKIHLATGDVDLAVSEFKTLLSNYPVPELYDKTRKALADAFVSQGDYTKAQTELDNMIYYDPLFDREGIERYRVEITQRKFLVGDTDITRMKVAEGWIGLGLKYPNSQNRNYYFLQAAELLEEAGAIFQALLSLDYIKEPNEEIQKRIEVLKSEIHGEKPESEESNPEDESREKPSEEPSDESIGEPSGESAEETVDSETSEPNGGES